MIELVPSTGRSVDVPTAVAAEHRQRSGRGPWVYTNMVSTIDGATAVDGVSGGLGGPADRQVFRALRTEADVILVGAATVRAEQYRPPQPSSADAERRRAAGRPTRPIIAVVTGSLGLAVDEPLFGDPTYRPMIITTEAAPPDRRAELESVADVVTAGADRVDLGAALAVLGDHQTVLAEGGPSLNGQLIADDLVDEWNLTLSPVLAGGSSSRSAHGEAVPDPHRFALDRLWHDSDLLFGRWLRH